MQAEIFRSKSEKNYRAKYPGNMFKAMHIIYRKEGLLALYQGLTASLIGLMHPIIYFPMYEKSKLFFLENFEEPGATSLSSKYIIVSSVTCKCLTSMVTYPHEVIRSR
jgi:solute carrier family 25 folate transporter 32